MPNLGDVIELTVDIARKNLHAGTQGTIVHSHGETAYEVEFINESGETVELIAVPPEQFIIVWQSATQTEVPIAQQATELISKLPQDAAKEVLDFARFLSIRNQQVLVPTEVAVRKHS